MIFGFVAKHRGIWPVAFLCEALGVSRSGFGKSVRANICHHAVIQGLPSSAVGTALEGGVFRSWGQAPRYLQSLLADDICC
jgi:putative transposase